MGRNRGIGVTLINQRAATINKDVLTQLDTLLAFQNVSPQDRKALKDWVEFHAAEGDFEKFMASLPSLPKGEGWIWSPEFLGIFERIKIRKRETFHPDREKIGDKFIMPELAQTDIQSFISRFADSLKDDKKKKGLPKKLADLSKFQDDLRPKESPELLALRNEYESKLMQKDIEIRNLISTIENVRKAVSNIIYQSQSQPMSASVSKLGALIENLPSYEKDIMQAISQHPNIPFTRSQLAIKAKKSYTSSAYLAAIRKLLKLGMLKKQGTDIIYEG